ncbi:MAG: hypothetical protein AB7O37_21415 [Vicinamibacteria bacterium]
MRRALPAAALSLAALAAAAVAFAPSVREPVAGPARPVSASPAPELRVPTPPELKRDPFRYAQARLPARAPADDGGMASGSDEEPVATLPAEPPVRLVGILRRGGGLRGALSIHGELALLAVGEQAGGFTLRGLDEDTGARIEAPDGSILQLRPR